MNLQEQLASEYILYGYQLSTAVSTDLLGTTYKAISQPQQAPIAVQVFTPVVCENHALIEALEDYAFQQSKLAHPNVQRIFELTNGSSGCVLIKEFIQGVRLDAYLKKKKVVDWQLTLRFLKQLLYGLAHVHEAGFIHGSLSPENIYVSRGNSLKLTDIGLNHIIKEHGLLSEEDWDQSNTRKYVAPEVLSGEYPASHESSDIYSIGLIAYEMLTGMSPGGHSDSNYFVEEHLSVKPTDPAHFLNRTIPEELSDIVQRATEHHAIHRFPTVMAMFEALEEIDATSVKPNVVYHRRTTKKRGASLTLPGTLIFVGAMLAITSAGFYFFRYLDKENPFVALQDDVSITQTLNEASAANPETEVFTSSIPLSPDAADSTHLEATPLVIQDEDVSPEDRLLPSEKATAEQTTITIEPAISESTAVGVVFNESQIQDELISAGPTDIEAPKIGEQASTPLPSPLEEKENIYAQPSKHALMVRSDPTGATVSIDGKEMGVTPFQLSRVSENRMRIELALAGYSTLREDIQLDDDKSTEAFFRLTPNNRPLIISVFPWGNVYVDDQLMSERVSGTDTLMITRENTSVSVKHPSFGNWEKRLNQQTEGPLSFTIDFRERATLHISAFDEENQPVAGEVIIDGHNTKQFTPIATELTFGTHSIEIRADGFKSFNFITTIDAENGQPQPLKVQLTRK